MATAIPEVGLKKAKEPPKECRPRTYCSRPPSHSYLGRRGADAMQSRMQFQVQVISGHQMISSNLATQSSQAQVIMRRNHRSSVFISGTLIGHQRPASVISGPHRSSSSVISGTRTDWRPHAMRVVISGTRTDWRPHCNESGHQWPSVIISSNPRSSLLPLEAACPHTLAK